MRIVLIPFVALFLSCTENTVNQASLAWPGGDPRSIVFVTPREGIIVGLNGLVSYSFDGGENWSTLDPVTNQNLHDVRVSPGRIWAVGSDGIILTKSKIFDPWLQRFVPHVFPPYLNSIAVADDSVAVTVSEDGVIFRTSDTGLSWSTVYSTPFSGTASYYDVKFADTDTVIVVGSGYSVIKSTDRGVTWRAIPLPGIPMLSGLAFASTSVGVAVGQFGHAVKTTDCGESWRVVPTGTDIDLYGVCFSDSINGLAVGRFGTVLTTMDAGSSWQAISLSSSRELVAVVAPLPNVAYAVGSSGAFVKVMDGKAIVIH